MEPFKDMFVIFIIFCTLLGCKAPFPNDTSVYKSENLHFRRFKPLTEKKYRGDTIYIGDYLIFNGRTASNLSEREFLEVNEDSILSKMTEILAKMGVHHKIDKSGKNLYNPNIFFDSSNKTVINGIEKNIHKVKSTNSVLKNNKFLIPAFVYRKDHDASSFNGPGDVKVRYFVTFMVFIYNEKNDLVYKNERSISAKPESIKHWEEALAFPIEDRVTEAHFEEMIREALRSYLEL